MTASDSREQSDPTLKNVTVVLQRPRFPENIGSAARAMRNMGLRDLVVVEPENFDLTRVQTLATHVAADVVAGIRRFPDLASALADCHYVVGTTARLGGQRRVVGEPRRTAAKLRRLAATNRVALVFGPEDRGLSNADLRLCHELVTIPTADFASLNLAQAVMVMAYEIFCADRPEPARQAPRLASRHELDGMYAQLRDILARIHFINPENPDYWMGRLRHFGTRMQLRAKEVSIIRGVCRQIDWYAEKRYRDGVEDRC